MMMIDKIIGNYKILEKIGEGGMGEVFRGLDIMLEREVAIKALRPELAMRRDIVERFRAEAMALARLSHPNIVTLYNFFRHQDRFFMVLEFVRGETLDKLINRYGAIPWRQAIKLICQALAGLEHAHELGVIHRDIKPANILLTHSGTLKLMDFGIARILERARLTKTGQLFGTLEYISPEQIQGIHIDARSDLYSLGAVLYEMLTGHVPFERGSDYALIKSQVEEPPPPLREFITGLPQELEAAVLRALAKAAHQRFKNAAAFRAALEAILDSTPVAKPSADARNAPIKNTVTIPETRLGIQPFSVPLRDARLKAHPIREGAPPLVEGHRAARVLPRLKASYLKSFPSLAMVVVLLSLSAVLISVTRQNVQWATVFSNSVESGQSAADGAFVTSSAERSWSIDELSSVLQVIDSAKELLPPIAVNFPSAAIAIPEQDPPETEVTLAPQVADPIKELPRPEEAAPPAADVKPPPRKTASREGPGKSSRSYPIESSVEDNQGWSIRK